MTRHQYFDSVRGIARDIVDRATHGRDAGDINDEFPDWVHEDVDGSEWVIYTYRAMKVVTEYSDNSEAGPDGMGWQGFSEGATGWSDLFSRGAYFAMCADVHEAIEELIEAGGAA